MRPTLPDPQRHNLIPAPPAVLPRSPIHHQVILHLPIRIDPIQRRAAVPDPLPQNMPDRLMQRRHLLITQLRRLPQRMQPRPEQLLEQQGPVVAPRVLLQELAAGPKRPTERRISRSHIC